MLSLLLTNVVDGLLLSDVLSLTRFLADGIPRKLAILGSALYLSFVNYIGLTIVGYVGIALGVISLALGVISLGVALGVKNQ
ncbi:hypothetical protein RND71_003484 [Anisodus tanguticus]|uniref:Uncharacterized protein n=1 Tax=Anisodus tanguticus TaxID=243964 RepID=A0AAE1STD1_9SOLA|nr:hypothetical protein RND71_003484 [Anisodus tanguticus]